LVMAWIYTLIAIGCSLLFGVLDVIHFARGDVYFLAPYISIGLVGSIIGWIGTANPWSMFGAIIVSIFCVGVFGMLIYLIVVRPFQSSSQLIVLVATVALGIVIRQTVRHVVPQGSTA